MAATPPSIDKYFVKVWQNNQGFLIIILLIIVLVVAVQTGNNVSNGIKRIWINLFGSPDAPTGRPEPNQNNFPAGWSPSALVAQFWAVLDGWGVDGGTKCEVAKRIFELNNDQFLAVNNEFEKKHADVNYPSMRSKMQGEWSTCSYFGEDYFLKIYQRMDALGIE